MEVQSRKRSAPAVFIALAVLIPTLLLGYVAGYFVLGSARPKFWPVRVFYAKWQRDLYQPAVVVEAWLTGEEVEGGWMLPDTVQQKQPANSN